MSALDKDDYWARFWSEYQTDVAAMDEQSQVLRTRNKMPIDEARWQLTLESVAAQLDFSPDDTLLDLCCGNGLFTMAFNGLVARVEALDICEPLIERLKAKSLQNVCAQAMDIREADFLPQSFSKVLWYAGIQYLDEADIVRMMRKICGWMKPGGILFIGDVPDRAKLWNYFNDTQRKTAYFDALAARQPIIGTWLEADWLAQLCLAAGFTQAQAVPQDAQLIYADFRYDLLARA